MDDEVSFRELLAFTGAQTERWYAWVREQPATALRQAGHSQPWRHDGRMTEAV
jgi:hypothetical protein